MRGILANDNLPIKLFLNYFCTNFNQFVGHTTDTKVHCSYDFFMREY